MKSRTSPRPSVLPRHRRRSLAVLAAIGGLVLTGAPAAAAHASPSPATGNHASSVEMAKRSRLHGKLPTGHLYVQPVCAATAKKTQARCFSLRVVSTKITKGVQSLDATPSGYAPADLRSAYNIPENGGAGATIAIVDAYDDPNAEADLEVYRAQYGLPALTPGQFTKVNQQGQQGNYPAPSANWAPEISLDLDMVSALAPQAKIILVEGNSAGIDDLGTSVNTAVSLGAGYVSNSYGTGYNSTPGSGEDPTDLQYDSQYYQHPGVAVVASSGDGAYGVAYPAASPYVTSVGGTSLTRDSSTSRGWTESVWNNAYGGPGSGCSLYEPQPSFQANIATQCGKRAVADVSAVADPATGVAVYDSYGGANGWAVYGGTSVAAPLISAVYADAGPISAGTYPNTYPYNNPSALNDVTTGNNGTCSPSVWCTATQGWDGPTGLGTPNGLAAFANGPHGEVTGTVTDASTGKPIVGAKVSIGDRSELTTTAGTYDLVVQPGTYTVSASAYGYVTKSVNGVGVGDGDTITENLALSAAASETVTGKVSDGSGHGWPLYATVTIGGAPAPVYTNPFTGQYSLKLPVGATYTVDFAANYPGYVPVTKTITASGGSAVVNVAMNADVIQGVAPGYTQHITGGVQAFSRTSTPRGWTVRNATTGGGWVFNNPYNRPNVTGGSGNFALVDSDHDGPGKSQDTSLIPPAADFSTAAYPAVEFDTHYSGSSGQVGDVDYSTDGGKTWINAWEQTTLAANGKQFVPLPGAAHQPHVLIRFHFTATWGFYWEIDNVAFGNLYLTQSRGGLIAGNVTDATSGAGLNGATVSDHRATDPTVTTAATPDDPNLPDGFYWFFATGSGNRTLSASLNSYATSTVDTHLVPDSTSEANIALEAASR